MKRLFLSAQIGLLALATFAAPPDAPGAMLKMVRELPPLAPQATRRSTDWLVTPSHETKAGIYRGASDKEIVLDNGLIRRTFRVHPNAATVGFDNLATGASVIRAVKPEALISIDGKPMDVGGLKGQPEQAYLLPEWIDQMTPVSGSLQCVGVEFGRAEAPFEWKRTRRVADFPWPPAGVATRFLYEAADDALHGLTVTIHYELYDGLPVIAKWMTVHNGTDRTLTLDALTTEILAPVEVESAVDERPFRNWRLPAIDLLSDYSFHGMDATTASQTTTWLADPLYTSQVNYELKMPALVVSRPPIGPDLRMAPGESVVSFRTFVVIHDSDSRERQGLALRKTQRALAPWAAENPIMMHVRSADSTIFRNAVDQCAEVGFEMIIYTFGSGLDMESTDPDYLKRIKADVDYAHGKGLEVGAYSLLASRRVSDEHDVINPATGKPGGAIFGNSPCLGSRWGEEYFRKIARFITETGLDLLEHDGSYPGDLCASTEHPGHRGLKDSQWTQWRAITDFYKWCRARGLYLNVPDYYFLAGSSKTGMGYRESNWSLPRERQLILGRQNIYDGVWSKAPSMGWMFVPLVEYHGGGAAATLEPLHEHLDAYEAHLVNNFGAGVQACFRGPRLYDTEATKAVVQKWVAWFKKHRDILESDIIHVRRPDGRDIDCFLHVNPSLEKKAMAVVYNPLDHPVERSLTLPLYYAGLTRNILVREREGELKKFALDREDSVTLPVVVPARGYTWFVMENDD